MLKQNKQKRDPKEIALDYWYFIADIQSAEMSFSVYGINQKRIDLHNELCEALGLRKEETEDITNNLDQCEDFDDFYNRLLKLKGESEKK